MLPKSNKLYLKAIVLGFFGFDIYDHCLIIVVYSMRFSVGS